MINGMVILSLKVHSIEPTIKIARNDLARGRGSGREVQSRPCRTEEKSHIKMFCNLIRIILGHAYYQNKENHFDFPLSLPLQCCMLFN